LAFAALARAWTEEAGEADAAERETELFHELRRLSHMLGMWKGLVDVLQKADTRYRWVEADGVIVVSRELADTVIRMGVDPDRVGVRYDGVDPDVFHPGPRAAARARLGVDPTATRVLFIGNLVEVKGIDVLFEACHRLRQGGFDFELDLIGQGPLRETLEKQVRRLGMSHFRFRGALPQAELPDWYRAADVFVLPSRSEGVPNVLLEAMACRTPFVASRVGGIPEVAVPEVGRLVPPNAPACSVTGQPTALPAQACVLHAV